MKSAINPFKSFNDEHIAIKFDNPNEFIKLVSENCNQSHISDIGTNGDFFGKRNAKDLFAALETGDKALAEKAATIMDKIKGNTPATVKRKRVSSPVGKASIGAYLANDPFPCRIRKKIKTKSAPLSIVVSLNSIGSVETQHLIKRGIAIAAMVRKVAKERPVKLYLSRFSKYSGSNSAMLVNFPTAPIDSYRLATLLSDQGFARGMGFAFHNCAYKIAGHGKAKQYSQAIYFAGGDVYSQTRRCLYAKDLAQYMGHEVFYIPGSDPDHKEFKTMVRDPIAWVNETADELTR